MKVSPLYDSIGSAYSLTRREDPRIAERIRLALGARDGHQRRCRHGIVEPVVLFAAEPELNTSWWLHSYFPSARVLGVARTPRLQTIAAVLGGAVEVTRVPIQGDCLDWFEGTYRRRPHAITDPAVWRGI